MADVRDCEGCPLVPRRDFLRDAALALVGLGLLPAAASAMPVEFVSSLGGTRADKVYAIPAKDGTQIDKDEETMITRWQGKLFVFALTCPHQNTALKWYEKDKQFECPKHHSRFSPDGVYIKDSGRATRGLDRFAVRRDGNNVHVNLDKLYQEDDNEAEWKAAFITL
jgi:nitrite reductase/ring-hydroxylating ferredoxin subunit